MLQQQCCCLAAVMDHFQGVSRILVQGYCLVILVMTGWNAMIIMWDRETVTRSVQKTRRWIIIAVLKWTLLTLVSVGESKTERG